MCVLLPRVPWLWHDTGLEVLLLDKQVSMGP